MATLAEKMVGDGTVQDKPDAEESHIPAAYTYFGQFVDHDITFDPSSFSQQQSNAKAITDFRTPRFDLDSVYGRGPSDQPYLYDGNKLQLGDKFFIVERNPAARDLPRAQANSQGNRRAITGDPRNDENAIVSQLHGMILRFHNAVADHMAKKNANVGFEEIRKEVLWHYQWIVIHDFLPRLAEASVLDAVAKGIRDPKQGLKGVSLKHYGKAFPHEVRMPVEFSVAAYRMGHSMVRPGYRVNEFTAPIKIFDRENPTNGLNAFGEFPKSWAIDWQRFIDLGRGPAVKTDSDRVQMAYRIDTSMVDPLAHLPHSVAGDEADPPKGDARLQSLAFRNLRRGQLELLPTGQETADCMGLPKLENKDIWMGTAQNNDDGTARAEDVEATNIKDVAGGAFIDKCPLFVYILAEARHNFFSHGEARLGHVGGTIVAETFVALLQRDQNSFVHDANWKPTLGKTAGDFTLADLLNFALDHS